MIKLNIGCGPNIFPFSGWINYDKVKLHSNFNYFKMMARSMSLSEQDNIEYHPECKKALQKIGQEEKTLINYIKNGGEIIFKQHNLTNKFNHNDNTVDVIYAGQIIEHLGFIHQVPQFLRNVIEC